MKRLLLSALALGCIVLRAEEDSAKEGQVRTSFQLKLCGGVDRCGRFEHHLSLDTDLSGHDQRLSFGSRFSQSAFDKEQV